MIGVYAKRYSTDITKRYRDHSMPENSPNPAPGGQEEAHPPAGSDPGGLGTCLFSGIRMRGPLEELDRVYQNRSRGLESTGSREQLERLSRGFEIAGNRLSICLGLTPDPQEEEQDPAGEGGEAD